MQQRRFVAPAGGVAGGLAQEPVDPLPVHRALRLRKHQLVDADADRLRARPSHQRLGVRAPVEDDAEFIGLDKGVERAVDDRLRHLLAVDQRLVGPLLLGHVARHRTAPQTVPRLVAQRTRVAAMFSLTPGRLGLDDELEVVDILAAQRARQRRTRPASASHRRPENT